MNFSRAIEISKPIAEVWQIMAVDFDRASVWMASIPHSYARPEGAIAVGAPMSGRICELSSSKTKNMVSETITMFDDKNHVLRFEVVPKNMSRAVPFSKNTVVASMTDLGAGKTRVHWDLHIGLKPHGYLLYPVAWLGFRKFLKNVLEELQHFSETGRPHPRKKMHVTKGNLTTA